MVAQDVPSVTGSFTNTGAGAGANGAVNPFQTIQREEVGTILKVTPTISAEGTSVMLKLAIESSTIAQKPAGAVDLVTNKRTVTTNVLVEDGGVVVLGGLLQNNNQKQESRVPVLGSIPLIGLALETRSASAEKDDLLIFIRPKIMRDASQAAYETDLKYNYMQAQQRGFEHREIPPLLPGDRQPRLPPLPPPAPSQPPQTPEEQARQSEARRNAEDAAERDRQRALELQAPQGAAPAPATTAPPSPTAPPPQDGGKR